MKRSEFEFGILEESDLDAVMDIEETAYGHHHWSKDSFKNELQNKIATYYAAKTPDGQLVGYIGFWTIVDEAHITTISVHKDYRRQHIAEKLIAKIIEDCYNAFVKYITLEVRATNEPAIRLYSKFGLKSLGTRKGYYQDNGEDALIMWTENIFSDNFKNIYNNIKEQIYND